VQLTSFGQPAPAPDAPPAPPAAPAPPADALPPAPPADAPVPPPADVPPAPPADAPVVDAPPQHASQVGYTRQLWEAIRGADIHGNDALDALAQPPQAG
jgi:hypothetical protein